MGEIICRIINKLASGRYLLTLCVGFTFMQMAITGKLSNEFIANVAGMVFTLYFTRQDRNINVEKRKELP